MSQPGYNPVVGRLNIRVRYAEVDQQGAVHHSRYAVYFEMGRTELLRDKGYEYKDLESQGTLLVVARYQCRFYAPARYDDQLELITSISRANRAKIEHDYELVRLPERQRVATAATTLVCVDRSGRLQPIPDFLLPPE